MANEHNPAFLAIVGQAKSRITEITVEEVIRKQAAGEAFQLVDVREDREFDTDRCAGSIHIGKGVIERDVEKARQKNEVVAECLKNLKSGNEFTLWQSVKKLSMIKDPDTLPAVLKVVDAYRGPLKPVMLKYLGEWEMAEANALLMKYVDHPDKKIRACTIYSLNQINKIYIVEPAEWKSWWADQQAEKK